MKRITLTLAVAGALLVPALLLTGSAGAANPHGPKGDPNASCGGGNGGPPCSDPGLPQSEGCLHGQAPVQNPHCQPAPGATGITPAAPTPVSTPAPAPATSGPKPAQGVAGAEAGKQASGNRGTAAAVGGKQIQELPFTGLSAVWLALIGAGMLALGLVLRARTSLPSDTPAPADPPETSEASAWEVPELGIAPVNRRRAVSLPFSEFEALGRMLIGKGHARLGVEPGGALAVVWDTG